MKISALHIANLFAYGNYLGIPEELLRKQLSFPNMDVCVLENTISDVEFLKVFKILNQKVEHQYFGLYYGCYLNIKSLGLIADLSLNATSIEQAVMMVQQYLKTTFPLISLTSRMNGERYEMHIHTALKETSLKYHLLDVVLCFVYRELRLMLGREVEIIVEQPNANVKEYATLLHTKVLQGNRHSLSLNSAVLATEMNKESTKTISYLLPKFVMMFGDTPKDYQGFSLQVRHMILSMCCPEPPTFQQLAKQFPLSRRTIQRKLTDENQSFRKIINTIRKELSQHLIQAKWIKTKEISHVLGYSETSAYLHALKRWKEET